MGDINNLNENENSNINESSNEFLDSNVSENSTPTPSADEPETTDYSNLNNNESNSTTSNLNNDENNSTTSNLSNDENNSYTSNATNDESNTNTTSSDNNYNTDSFEHSQATTSHTDIPGKKLSGKFVALIIAFIVIFAGAIIAFANRNALANTISRMTKSSAEYYAYIEQKGLNSNIDKLTTSYAKYIKKFNEQTTNGAGQDLSMKFTINPQIASTFGTTGFESVEAFISSFSKNGNSKSNLGFAYNGTNLISADTYLDAETNKIYMAIPELSSAYLLLSLDELMSVSDSYTEGFNYNEYLNKIQNVLSEDTLSSETLNKLLKKYTSLMVTNIKNVTVENASTFTASEISSKLTTIKCEITDEDAYNIALAILNEAKEDKDIIDLCKKLDLCTEEEYMTAIENAINSLSQTPSANSSLFMNVYVDKNGNIVGREFKFDEDSGNISLGYYITEKSNKFGIKAWVKEGETEVFNITGDAKYANGSYTGKCKVSVSAYDDTYGENSTTSFDIEFENADILDDNGHINGKYTLSTDLAAGAKLVFDCKADKNQQQVTIKGIYAGMEAATLDIIGKDVDYEDFSFPADSEQTFDALTDMNSYLATVDYEGFISKVEDTLGIDNLEDYLGYFLQNMTY